MLLLLLKTVPVSGTKIEILGSWGVNPPASAARVQILGSWGEQVAPSNTQRIQILGSWGLTPIGAVIDGPSTDKMIWDYLEEIHVWIDVQDGAIVNAIAVAGNGSPLDATYIDKHAYVIAPLSEMEAGTTVTFDFEAHMPGDPVPGDTAQLVVIVKPAAEYILDSDGTGWVPYVEERIKIGP